MVQYGLTGHWVISSQITYATTDSTAMIDIPDKTYVSEVAVIITTAFAGTSPTVDVGDGANGADAWIDNVSVTDGTIGSYKGDHTNTAELGDHGKYYASADTIDIDIGGTNLTAGACYVMAYLIPLSDIV